MGHVHHRHGAHGNFGADSDSSEINWGSHRVFGSIRDVGKLYFRPRCGCHLTVELLFEREAQIMGGVAYQMGFME